MSGRYRRIMSHAGERLEWVSRDGALWDWRLSIGGVYLLVALEHAVFDDVHDGVGGGF